MWNYSKIKNALYWAALLVGILGLSLVIANSATAWTDNLDVPIKDRPNLYNSGSLDARGSGHPTGYDGTQEYMMDYMAERERMREEDMRELREELESDL